MSDQINERLASNPKPPAQKKSPAILGITILMVGVLAGGAGFGYFKVTQMIDELRLETLAAQSNVTLLKASVEALRQSAEQSQALSAKQEKMISDWQATQKGDLNKWYIAEAAHLVQLADDHVQYSHDLRMAVTLLQRADQVLSNVQEGNVAELRQALTNDIANLQAAPSIDVTHLYLRLTAMNAELDNLPLLLNPLKPDAMLQESVREIKNPESKSWWQAGANRVTELLSKIVIVRHTNSTVMPVVLPEEKAFLYQNLHAQMESAMWALLNRNPEVYQASLARLTTWIQQYYAQSAPATITMLQNLQSMRSLNLQPAAINLSATVQLFKKAVS